MTWLDDELRAYEESKQGRAQRDELILSRSQLRKTQALHRWIDLQGQLRGAIVQLNIKAGRTVFEDVPVAANRLFIQREDGISLAVQFNTDLNRVSCAFESCPCHNRDFELIVKPIDGNDATIWSDMQTRAGESDERIAESLISSLMRCAA